MIYLDYQATTPTNEEVLNTFVNISKKYFANSNSIHNLGLKSKQVEEYATNAIKNILKVPNHEIIYTSSASEANNHALKGICHKYKNRGKHILTTKLEHSSITKTCSFLEEEGFEIEYLNLLETGQIDIEDLKSKLRDDTILVTIASVDSELGIKQPIEEIATILKEYPKVFFHVDCTQSIGKININLSNIDLISASAHKIYGIKGIAMLIKKENIDITPLIHGGKSTTIYRSSTPTTALIASLKTTLDLIIPNVDKNLEYITNLNEIIINKLKEYPKVYINSTTKSIPHTINISMFDIKPETFVHSLEEEDIYISTKSACSSNSSLSTPVLEVTKDQNRAKSSIRISLSYLTTKEEINKFLDTFNKCYHKLMLNER